MEKSKSEKQIEEMLPDIEISEELRDLARELDKKEAIAKISSGDGGKLFEEYVQDKVSTSIFSLINNHKGMSEIEIKMVLSQLSILVEMLVKITDAPNQAGKLEEDIMIRIKTIKDSISKPRHNRGL